MSMEESIEQITNVLDILLEDKQVLKPVEYIQHLKKLLSSPWSEIYALSLRKIKSAKNKIPKEEANPLLQILIEAGKSRVEKDAINETKETLVTIKEFFREFSELEEKTTTGCSNLLGDLIKNESTEFRNLGLSSVSELSSFLSNFEPIVTPLLTEVDQTGVDITRLNEVLTVTERVKSRLSPQQAAQIADHISTKMGSLNAGDGSTFDVLKRYLDSLLVFRVSLSDKGTAFNNLTTKFTQCLDLELRSKILKTAQKIKPDDTAPYNGLSKALLTKLQSVRTSIQGGTQIAPETVEAELKIFFLGVSLFFLDSPGEKQNVCGEFIEWLNFNRKITLQSFKKSFSKMQDKVKKDVLENLVAKANDDPTLLELVAGTLREIHDYIKDLRLDRLITNLADKVKTSTDINLKRQFSKVITSLKTVDFAKNTAVWGLVERFLLGPPEEIAIAIDFIPSYYGSTPPYKKKKDMREKLFDAIGKSRTEHIEGCYKILESMELLRGRAKNKLSELFKERKIALVILGKTNTAIGLNQYDYVDEHGIDGKTVAEIRTGRDCRRTDFERTEKQNIFIYFRVDENYINKAIRKLQIAVEYFDEPNSDFKLEYQGTSSAYQPKDKEESKKNNNSWQKTRFTLTDAQFAKGQNGKNDFRIRSTGKKDVCIHSVAISVV